MKAAFLIAAPMSGAGKTSVARSLMALLTQQGYRVQPFKCGPDYIDTKFHEAACGRPSVNLDTFMAGEAHVRGLFARYTADADIAVAEGMMGMFDGFDRDRGSSADIARVLGLPVVLVVDARSAAFSTAALLSGFVHFRAHVRVAGVLYNKVGSARHARMLREAADEAGVPCLGCIPRQEALEQGSRYLGLDFSQLGGADNKGILAAEGEAAVIDLPRLLALTACGPADSDISPWPQPKPAGRRFLVARDDEAFSFLYQETLDDLAARGSVTFFDPADEAAASLLESQLSAADLLYLPGGYPEKHAGALAKAGRVRSLIRAYARGGGHIVAECGGMMYLCEQIIADDGAFPMCGVLPYTITARRQDRRLSLGYRRFTLGACELRGHEFHYTQFLGATPPSAAQVYNAKDEPVATPVFRYLNVLASYTHLASLTPLLDAC